MDIKMNDKSGVTLKTAGKYCTEDIVVTPNFEIGITPTGSIEITENGTYDVTDKASAVVNVESDLQSKTITENGTYTPDSGYDGFSQVTVNVAGSGGSSDLVEVEALPTENIDASKIYVVNQARGIEVYFCYGSGYLTLAEAVAEGLGSAPTIYYEVVSELPASPTATNLQTFNPIYCYIYNNVAYVYGNAGTGDMWLTVSALFASMGATIEDKGRTADITQETVEGLYTYWADKVVGVPNKFGNAYIYNGTNWVKYYLPNLQEKEATENDVTVTADEGYVGLSRVIINVPSLIYSYRMDERAGLVAPYAYCEMPIVEFVIPEGITGISDFAFLYCTKLEKITIPNGVTFIGDGAFLECESLKSVNIPEGANIGPKAFEACTSLTSVSLPNATDQLRNMVFQGCINLTNVTVGNAVNLVSTYAFANCSKVLKYDFSNSTIIPYLDNINAFNGINDNCKIVVPDSLYDEWITATNWSYFASYIVKASEYTA